MEKEKNRSCKQRKRRTMNSLFIKYNAGYLLLPPLFSHTKPPLYCQIHLHPTFIELKKNTAAKKRPKPREDPVNTPILLAARTEHRNFQINASSAVTKSSRLFRLEHYQNHDQSPNLPKESAPKP